MPALTDPGAGRPSITLIAAMSLNRVIGHNGKLPWRLQSDLARFRKQTMGKPMIIGRRTYDDIGRPLPGRTLIVLTSKPMDARPGVVVANSLADALRLAAEDAANRGVDEIMVAGGASVYQEALPQSRKILLTIVETKLAGDTYFPDLDLDCWKEAARHKYPVSASDDFPTTVFELCR